MIHCGDLFDVLPTLAAESIDACVTDPPYGLEFMGKEWDAPWKHAFTEHGARPGLLLPVSSTRNPVCRTCRKHQRGSKRCQCDSPNYDETPRSNNFLFQQWSERWGREVYRVLKPGAYLLVCGAPRSYHRMACGIEDAGFEIRDSLCWLFSQGFPKSLNIGCRCADRQPAPQSSVRRVPETNLSPSVQSGASEAQVLLDGVQEQGLHREGSKVEASVRPGESSVEGRKDAVH